MTDAESNLFDEIKENKVSDRGANYYGSSTRIPASSASSSSSSAAGDQSQTRQSKATVVS